MTEVRKMLGQASLAATTLTALYTVPAATEAVVASIIVCNRTAGTLSFRISIAVAGAADNVKQYIYYDLPLIAQDTFIATVGVTLGAGDVVRAYASATGLSVSLVGVEIS